MSIFKCLLYVQYHGTITFYTVIVFQCFIHQKYNILNVQNKDVFCCL